MTGKSDRPAKSTKPAAPKPVPLPATGGSYTLDGDQLKQTQAPATPVAPGKQEA